MLGYFPDPYPDELFYSLCARYSERMQYPGKTAVNQELFGLFMSSATIDLPGHLDFFAAALPLGHSCGDVNRVIERHTLWPFYRPFLSVERQQAVLAAMRGVTGHRPDLHAGTIRTGIPRPEWLRFCPKCVAEDRARFGECYWHRLHQAAGVYLCPNHEVLLENSSAGVGWRRASAEFIAAETILQSSPARLLPLSHPWREQLLRLSCDAAWLLDQPSGEVDQATVKQRYQIALSDQGLASYTGVVKTQKVRQAFIDFYPTDLLNWLHCPVDDTGPTSHWLGRLTRDKEQHVHPPVRHLLFIQFLGYTPQTLFALSLQPQPFGQGPWPCLNPVCPHYHQPVIETYHLESRQHALPVGTFSCECGFQYRRKGPDRSADDRFRGKRVAYGPLWDGELRRLWNDPAQSMARTARQLGVTERTLQAHAGRLGLPFPAPGSRVVAHSRRTPLPLERVDPCPSPEPADEYRAKWLEVLADQPDLGRYQLQRAFRPLYTWLYRYDRDWLIAHLPPPQKAGCLPKPKTPHIDWQTRDSQVAQAVKTAAQHLRQQPGRPIWITKAAIARQVKLFNISRYTLEKLPLTTKVLSEVTETWQETAIRRVRWAADCYRQEGVCPSRYQLVSRAGAKEGQKNSALIKETLDAALAMLNQNISPT